jgi:hypothetical protein
MMKTNTSKITIDYSAEWPRLMPGSTVLSRVAPPRGSVAYTGRTLNMNMASIGRRVNPLLKGITNLDHLDLITDEEARMNLESTKARFLELGVPGTITSSYRSTARNRATPYASDTSDHHRGLALDVAYGNYEETKRAFGKIVVSNSSRKYIRQIIFENVRGTERGYHIHIGFYRPGVTGEILSSLWFSAKEGKYRDVEAASSNNIPSKERFEDV